MSRFRFILIIALGTLLLIALLPAGAFCQVEAGNEPVESQLGEGAWYTAPDGTTVVFPENLEIHLRYLDGQALIQYPYITRILTNRENPVVGLGWHHEEGTPGGIFEVSGSDYTKRVAWEILRALDKPEVINRQLLVVTCKVVSLQEPSPLLMVPSYPINVTLSDGTVVSLDSRVVRPQQYEGLALLHPTDPQSASLDEPLLFPAVNTLPPLGVVRDILADSKRILCSGSEVVPVGGPAHGVIKVRRAGQVWDMPFFITPLAVSGARITVMCTLPYLRRVSEEKLEPAAAESNTQAAAQQPPAPRREYEVAYMNVQYSAGAEQQVAVGLVEPYPPGEPTIVYLVRVRLAPR